MLILASGSPRRRQLLDDAGIRHSVTVPDVPEWEPERGDPHEVAAENARRKAEAVEGEQVLAADTVVALGDQLLAKPADKAEARAMLARLAGTTHAVVTGVAVRVGGRLAVRTQETRVTMRALTDDELDAYAASGEGLGKAGGYAIQETADAFVESVDGPFDNVVGLPVDLVRTLLAELS